MNHPPRRDGYYTHHGMTQDGSPLRHHFSAEAARRLNDRHLSPQEWDMVMQARMDNLLRPYEDALRHKDGQITKLRQQVEGYQKAEQERLLKEFLDAGKNKPIMLIDGSGSMAASGRAASSPLSASLSAAQQSGIKRVMLWGDRKPTMFDLTQPNSMALATQGLLSGTDLFPTLEVLAAVEKPRHIVIVSDGDIFDIEKSKPVLLGLLEKHTVSVILVKSTFNSVAANDTHMQKLVSEINASSDAKKIGVAACNADATQIQSALAKLAAKPATKKTAAHKPKR